MFLFCFGGFDIMLFSVFILICGSMSLFYYLFSRTHNS
eukprot:UN27223